MASLKTIGSPAPVMSQSIPARAGVASSQIKHVIFINKENATHDLMLGDITSTRRGAPVDGDPAFSLGPAASPNHHELALRYTFGDNFFLEPTVSSDGHRWLTNTYTTELEEAHWPASYGGRKRDSGDDPEVIANYPGRIGFTDANSSPEPNDLNEHGGIYAPLLRHGRDFVNFGMASSSLWLTRTERTSRPVFGAPPTSHGKDPSARSHRSPVPEYNTHIPDAPLPENPGIASTVLAGSRGVRGALVDRGGQTLASCRATLDLYYPNDTGAAPTTINPAGRPVDYTRSLQDNDAALGLTVELVSNSPCWKDTRSSSLSRNDTQIGPTTSRVPLDLPGHLPRVKREHVTKQHISWRRSQDRRPHFGMPPLNQYDTQRATDLRDIFTAQARLPRL